MRYLERTEDVEAAKIDRLLVLEHYVLEQMLGLIGTLSVATIYSRIQ